MADATRRAVVLLSGGLDSSVAMAMALAEGIRVCRAVTFDYGQRAASKEILKSRLIARHYGVLHSVIPLPWFRELWSGGALLTETEALPHPTFFELSDHASCTRSAKKVWVPNRNGVFLEIAAGIAESRGASSVIVGFNREEAATFPDNSITYIRALNEALKYSTANEVRVVSPTAEMEKVEIVRKAIEVDFPLSLIWSCYEGQEHMCGVCESCMRLKRALIANQAGDYIAFANTLR